MRFIYMILIGLIVFNASLMLYAGSFDYASTSGLENNAVNTTVKYSRYGDVTNLWDAVILGTDDTPGLFNIVTITTVLGTMGIGGLIGKFTGGQYSITLVAGVGMFIGIIMSFWNQTFFVISNLTGAYGWLLNGLVTIISMAIGIIIIFNVIELFTGQQGVS